ncbi:MAG: c-type cytochrome domain-containing protein, partial [Verrucomicrobiota bacterium]
MRAVFSCFLIFISLRAPPAAADEFEFFEKKIRPIFVESCYKCHSVGAEKLKGGLLLDSKTGILKGGESGPAIVEGDVEKSLLIRAVRYTDKDLQMPPKDKKLSAQQIADFETWVKAGAPDPRTNVVQSSKA